MSYTTYTTFETDYTCTFGETFRKDFWPLLGDYSSVLPLIFSFIVINRAMQKWRQWWFWLAISILIAIQSASSLIFSSSFTCTNGVLKAILSIDGENFFLPIGNKPFYAESYGNWDIWYISFYLLAGATEAAVDLIWIYIYTDAVYVK